MCLHTSGLTGELSASEKPLLEDPRDPLAEGLRIRVEGLGLDVLGFTVELRISDWGLWFTV